MLTSSLGAGFGVIRGSNSSLSSQDIFQSKLITLIRTRSFVY